ncbi:response regulator transcription factor [Anaerobacillus sp. MEB173]|uniref:response regulator transcription factor n=1 Tax=Anaerobacillus sp. MEB173 TaxID=3383345 RepID=UPI003F92D687
MTSYSTIQEKIQKLEKISSHEEQLYKLLEVYLELFPVKNGYLFRYSPLGYVGEGIVALFSTGFTHIRDNRDDIRSLPTIYSALRERKAKYCTGVEHFLNVSSKYILPSHINCLLVVPICFGNFSTGYICTNEFKEGTIVDDDLLSQVTHFGKLVGKIIDKYSPEDSVLLSKREMEVMRRISMGESTKEMSATMGIREVTVIQYVKTAVKKLNAQNRSQAVAELFRRGMIS